MDSNKYGEGKPPDLSAIGKILVVAHEDKRRLRTIGTGHLLLGLAWEDEAEISLIFQTFSINLHSVEAAFDSVVPCVKRKFWDKQKWDLDFSEVLDLSIETARRLDKGKVRPIHLLYAITKVPDCTAIKILRKMGVSIEALEKAISKYVSQTD